MAVCSPRAAGNGMTTSVIQQKGPNPKDESFFMERASDSNLYHRSGEKPLDPTTLVTTLAGAVQVRKAGKECELD